VDLGQRFSASVIPRSCRHHPIIQPAWRMGAGPCDPQADPGRQSRPAVRICRAHWRLDRERRRDYAADVIEDGASRMAQELTQTLAEFAASLTYDAIPERVRGYCKDVL